MDKRVNTRYKTKKLMRDIKGAWPLWLLLAFLIWGGVEIQKAESQKRAEEKKQKQEQLRTEQRGQEFAQYIVSGLADSANKSIKQSDVVSKSKQGKKHIDQSIQALVADSTKYANAMLQRQR